MEAYVKLENMTKIYRMGEVEIRAADGIDFEIMKGEFVVIVGPSGAGKTTVLNVLGGMDTATSGAIWVDGKDIAKYNPRELTGYRRDDIGFVFQFYNLISNLTALENVELALQICRDPLSARSVLKDVGLGDRMKNFPAQLSGGEQQRVSIARALAKNPKLLLCDEPTGALDYNTGKAILKLLQDTCREQGMTVIVITHQMSVVEQICTRVAILNHGSVVEEGVVSEVFASPESEEAKQLVYPEGYQQAIETEREEHLIRVVFNGASATQTPLIAKMAMEENIIASILFASTRSIGDKAYGNMLLGISGGKEQIEKAIAYLRRIPDIHAEEVTRDHG